MCREQFTRDLKTFNCSHGPVIYSQRHLRERLFESALYKWTYLLTYLCRWSSGSRRLDCDEITQVTWFGGAYMSWK